MDLGLKGKVAFVTGAGSQIGFGKGIALTLAKEGCDVIVTDIDVDGIKKTASEVEALGRKALALKLDVTNNAEVNDVVKKALAKFSKIDILVNNAGAAGPRKSFADKPTEEWDFDINLNLIGVLNCTKAVLPQMIARKSGKIITLTSGAGKLGGPMVTLYSASKGAVVAFTKALAREVSASGINANCVAPGIGRTNFVKTSAPGTVERFLTQTPTGRSTTPQDIGNMVTILASDVTSNVVGQTFNVDGGVDMTG